MKPTILSFIIFWIIVTSLLLTGTEATRRQKRQTETAVAVPNSSAMVALTNLVMPTIRALVQAPVKMIQELIIEIREFLSTHNFSEMLDTTFIRSIVQRLPERAGRYWMSFLELESECIQRTLCDVADFTTHQVPQWVKQILLVYFTTFNENIYFEAINNGLIAHNCQAKFSQCDPNSFLSKLSNNVSDSIHTTVSPIKDALNDLVNVTLSTLMVNDEPVTAASVRLEGESDNGEDLNGSVEDRLADPVQSDRPPMPPGFVFDPQPQQQPQPQQPPQSPMVLNQNSFVSGMQTPQFQPMGQSMPPRPIPMSQPFPQGSPPMMHIPTRTGRLSESDKVHFSS